MQKKLLCITNVDADISVLCDIRLSNKAHLVSNFVKNTEKGNFDFYHNSTKNGRGVGLLVNRRANLEVNILFKDEAENILLASIKKGQQEFILGSIYGPRQQDDINFIERLMDSCAQFKHLPLIIMGDYNMITNTSFPLKDVYGSVSIPNPRNSKKLEKIVNSGELKDVFRQLNGNQSSFSYMGFNSASSQRSRIDLSLCNNIMLRSIRKCKFIILPKTLFDHKLTLIELGGKKSKNMCANMNMLDLPLTNSIIHVAVVNAMMDNNNSDTPSNNTISDVSSRMEEIRGKLNICTNIYAEAIKRDDKFLIELTNTYESALKIDLLRLPVVEVIYKACNFKNDESLILQCILNEITNALKGFQALHSKLSNYMINDLYSKLREEHNKVPADPFKMFNLEQRISSIEEEKLHAWCARHQAWDILNREKTVKGFCSISKIMSKEVDFVSTIKNTEHDPPTEFKNSSELNSFVNGFYGKLFENNDDKCNLDIDKFFSDLNLEPGEIDEIKIPLELRDGLDREITLDEIEKSLKSTPGDSSPGMDGFSYNFIRKYFHLLKFPMMSCYKFWIRDGKVSHNFAISKIKLLPKKDKLFNIQSWRPIALLSCFYKVFSGVLSNRIKPIADIVNVLPQKAYSSERNIVECNVDLVNVIEAASAHNIPMAICALDFRKAFDSVSNAFALKLFEWIGCPPYLIKMLCTCLKGKNAYITNLENNNTMFRIGRGFAQGDRPSGVGFGLCVNVAFFRIIKHPDFIDATIPLERGVQGPENTLCSRASCFADDGQKKMRAVIENLILLKKVFNEFYNLCGLQTNFDKTAIIPFNAPQEFIDAIPAHGFRLEHEFTTLGVEYSTDHSKFVDTNQKNIRKKVDKIIGFWEKIYLSLVGKISIAKTFVYSQFAYLSTVITFTADFISEMEKKLSKFCNTNVKIGTEKVFQEVSTGGLGLFKLLDYTDSIRTSFFRRSINNKDQWAQAINNCRSVYNNEHFIEDEHLKSYFPASYRLLQTFIKFTNAYYMFRGNEGWNYVYNNPRIADRNQALSPPPGHTEGHPYTLHKLMIRDLVNNNNTLKTLGTLNTEQNTSITLTEYNKIKRATNKIRTIYKKGEEVKNEGINRLLNPKKKGSRPFRRILEKKKEKLTKNLTPTRTREKKFNFTHDPTTEKRLYSLWSSSFLNNEIRTFLFKAANNMIKLNVHISKFKPEQSELCKSCLMTGTSVREDFQHFYFDCPIIQGLLKSSKKIFREDFKNEPKIFLINNSGNNATNYEKIIAGIMCYIIFTHRNKHNNKTTQMNYEFRKIILSSCAASNYFNSQTSRFIQRELDPF